MKRLESGRPGAIVAFRERNGLGFGAVTGEERRGRIPLVRAQGKEDRVSESRIVVLVVPAGEEPSAERVERAQAAAVAESLKVDVPALWEVADEGPAETGARLLSTADLAELALGSSCGVARAALFLALFDDGIHFVLKGGAWTPRDQDAVAVIQKERELVARREAEKRQLFETLATLEQNTGFRPTGSEIETRYMDALWSLAVREDDASAADRQLAGEALAAAGTACERPHEGAFRLLVLLGRFSDENANLQPLRYGLSVVFPAPVLGAAERAAERGFGRRGRRDLRELTTVSIDSARTREIDDLLSVEALDAGCRLGIHIADPAAFVEPGDAVDVEARARGLTHYMPDLRLPMIPERISERAASLTEGEERPALSFLVDLDAAGHVTATEIVRSVVRSSARLTYDESDATIESGEGRHAGVLRLLAGIGPLRERVRAADGAVAVRGPEIDVHVLPDGSTALERLPADSAARRTVSEAMILAGEIAAKFCMAERLPAIYRRQSLGSRIVFDGDPAEDPVLRRRLRRRFKRATTGLEPGPHESLGLDAYAQVSSPLRRFQDLATHRQILSCLEGREPCYDREALQAIAATTEHAEADARRAEQAAKQFWLFRHLESERDHELDAVVVELDPRPIVLLTEVAREFPVRGLRGVELGQRVRVRVANVNPRAGLLVLI